MSNISSTSTSVTWTHSLGAMTVTYSASRKAVLRCPSNRNFENFIDIFPYMNSNQKRRFVQSCVQARRSPNNQWTNIV